MRLIFFSFRLYRRLVVTSVILGMTFCSMKTESCASTRMRPAWIFSLDFPSVSFDELVFPESTRKWASSDRKKSSNPFWTQPTRKSFILTNIPELSSRSWRKSWDDFKAFLNMGFVQRRKCQPKSNIVINNRRWKLPGIYLRCLEELPIC